jgi:hypothetical protein
VQIVTTHSSSVKEFASGSLNYAEVATTRVSGPYQVIDSPESLALPSERASVPVLHERAARTATVKKQSERIIASQISFKPQKLQPNSQANLRHLQCTVRRISRQPNEHKKINGKIHTALDGDDES